MDAQQTRQGVLFALAAFFIWGTSPVYFKLIQQVPSLEILSHRIIWSFVFLLLLLFATHSWHKIMSLCKTPHKLALLIVTACLISGNWLLFIWAINNNHILDASLGYFINPLVNVLLGIIFLGERFRRVQWLAILLAITGVLIQLWQFGSIPIIALGLTFSSAFYGLLRKKIAVDAQIGMLFETLWLMPIASIYLFFITNTATSHLSNNSLSLTLLLSTSGIITTIPLLFFTAAVTRLRLSTLGLIQYLAPTLMFLIATLYYKEQISVDKLITFTFIWTALILFTLDTLYNQHRQLRQRLGL